MCVGGICCGGINKREGVRGGGDLGRWDDVWELMYKGGGVGLNGEG